MIAEDDPAASRSSIYRHLSGAGPARRNVPHPRSDLDPGRRRPTIGRVIRFLPAHMIDDHIPHRYDDGGREVRDNRSRKPRVLIMPTTSRRDSARTRPASDQANSDLP